MLLTLERLRERLDQGLTEGKLGALPSTYTWAPLLQVALINNKLLNTLMEFPQPRGVVFVGAAGNGRHTTATALINSKGGHYLWLSGWDLDAEDAEESCETIRNVVRLAYEQGKLTLFLDAPENCRHNMLIQEMLARLLNNMDAGMLFPVIVTEQMSTVSIALRHHLMLCPCAAPNKQERDSWLKQKLDAPVPLKIDGMDRADLIKRTEGFSWQQLQDLINHLKLMIYRQALNRKDELAGRGIALSEAIKSGVVTVSNVAGEILLNQMENQNPKTVAAPVVQVVGGVAETAAKNQSNTNGMSHEEAQELITMLNDPGQMSADQLLNFDF